MASMPAVWTSPGGSSLVRRSTPRTSTPTVCGAACTKRAKTALRNGAAPRTAPVASPLLLERALAGCFRPSHLALPGADDLSLAHQQLGCAAQQIIAPRWVMNRPIGSVRVGYAYVQWTDFST